MTGPDRIAELSQRITTLTGQILSRDEVMTVVGRAFEHQVDLDDDGQLRALLGGLASSPVVRGPAVAAPQPGRPAVPPREPSPSGATAKTAAVLALLGGIANLAIGAVFFATGNYVSENDTMPGWYHAVYYVVAGGSVIVGGALLTGAVMMFRRKRFGPRIVAVGCALCLAVFFGDLAMTFAAADEGGVGMSGSPGRHLSGLVFPVLTLVLVLLPSTKRWVMREALLADGHLLPSQVPSDSPIPRTKTRGVVHIAGIVLVAASVVAGGVFVVNHFVRTQSTRTQSTTASSPDRRQIELPFADFDIVPLYGIAIDTGGNVYVSAEAGMFKLAPDTAAPIKLPFPKLRSTSYNEWHGPSDVAVDVAGNVYATYGQANRVLKLAVGASAPSELPLTDLGWPRGVAVDAAGNVYVADADGDNPRVLKLAVGADAPTKLPFVELEKPAGVAVDAGGNVYVTDVGAVHNGVFKLAAGSRTSTELPFNGWSRRSGIVVDTAGDIYVVDEHAKKVLKLAVGADAPTTLPFGDLNSPRAVAVDSTGDVYVIDGSGSNDRVVKLYAQ
ncbi:hypothetical protein [Mycobacteroides franklinii]|uniref:Serine/threonine-protein kinase PknD n=1 Tax=Mycobacteroides franklinii TaxID=948102 RepID=A0A4V3HVJ2_9MYCO|nr:hypothetical protein [Mycobacteroides franklinii]TDZ42225.1 Serine/threonine-protein kinase PknD [Mycobacteroides franklinii]TDZ52373.1 Serine/threonine-protein kinase PknD [Mycobacteroides franklinii]TDZ55780.1 Serine/threonine-protein kinase PknD [Mycobacteroides franklinii]TDZ62721.1 Serine/threonine-protein kinase PknD [Mycobacteroides franklinii]TDZ69118.1 Serine/threonine-protein kinase PknD [Mycobacteroides franklinii]